MRGYLGNQGGRNRPNKGPRHGGGGGGHGGGGHGNRSSHGNRLPDDMIPDQTPFIDSGEDAEIISPEELAQSRKSMNLNQLKSMPINKLMDMANSLGVENMGRSRKQDIIFGILKAQGKDGAPIYGDGVLEILQDGFGFLRSPDGS